jgi:hypothetical protein
MGGVAILFNPVLPITFTRTDWQPIDFGVAVVFSIALIQTLRRLHLRANARRQPEDAYRRRHALRVVPRGQSQIRSA